MIVITGAQGYKLIQRSFSSQIYDDSGDGEEDDDDGGGGDGEEEDGDDGGGSGDSEEDDDDDGGGGDSEEDWENNKYILWRIYQYIHHDTGCWNNSL